MARFLGGVVAVQAVFIVLTAVALPRDADLPYEELRDLKGLSAAAPPVSLERYGRFGTDLHATLSEDGPAKEVWISVRPGYSLQDYEARRGWDLDRVTLRDPERQRVAFEDASPERGYAVRFKGRGRIYGECVRLRAGVLILVRVSQDGVPSGREDHDLERCDQAAHRILGNLKLNLGWN
jgi:hypothetical protein